MSMARKPIQIDRAKLRAEVRKLGSECVFRMLDDAIDLLPPAKLHKMAKKYLGQDKYPGRQPGEVRVLYKIVPEKFSSMG